MKQISLLCILLLMLSCGTSKTVRDSKKVIKGSWTLSTIAYNKSGTFNVSLLEDAEASCFEGSTWQFIPNNNTGTYTINSSSCSEGERYFIFTIQEIDPETGLYDFLLKPTNDKKKSETNRGFRMQLTQLSDTNMQWQQTVSLEGSPFIISMNFSKR